MVTFITILQVNLVMSVLLYVMFLAYLYGIQASSMDRQRPTPDPINSLIIKLLQADISRTRPRTPQERQGESAQRAAQRVPPPSGMVPAAAPLGSRDGGSPAQQRSSGHQAATDISLELLQQHKRYNSPRVLLSDRPPMQPPPLYLMDDFVSSVDGGSGNKTRKKRYAEHKSYRGEYSVCDSESQWVTDKINAVDIRGNKVTVLGVIPSAGRPDVKQYFYETKCRNSKPFKNGCRGIDDKHWNSQCKTTQTYVRALTQDKVTVGWRWIRIDTSCVCALSRKRRRT
ncbi:neurotrophin-3 [Sardina pilchardus]|uniref:neurotrophin-3 n=1 Tax=Sardina pilchardus TaxID=27697 RepID=UPI002E117986